MTMLPVPQDGGLFEHVGKIADLDAAQVRNTMELLCPAIARQIKAKAENDPELLESLLDLIEDGAGEVPLDDIEALTGPEAIADGQAILGDIYGSRNAAMVALRKIAGDIPELALTKLAPISAASAVSAITRSNAAKIVPLASPLPAAGGESGGLFGSIVGAIVAGLVQGAVRQLKAKPRRRSTSYTRSRSRSKSRKKSTSTRRRSASLSIEDIFSEILGTKRN